MTGITWTFRRAGREMEATMVQGLALKRRDLVEMMERDDTTSLAIYGEVFDRVTLLARRRNMSRSDLLWGMLVFAVGERCTPGTDYKALSAEFAEGSKAYKGFSRTLVSLPLKSVLRSLALYTDGVDREVFASGLLLYALETLYAGKEEPEDRATAKAVAEDSRKRDADRSFGQWEESLCGLVEVVLADVAVERKKRATKRNRVLDFSVAHYGSVDELCKVTGFGEVLRALAAKYDFSYQLEDKESVGDWSGGGDRYVNLRVELAPLTVVPDDRQKPVVDALLAKIAAA